MGSSAEDLGLGVVGGTPRVGGRRPAPPDPFLDGVTPSPFPWVGCRAARPPFRSSVPSLLQPIHLFPDRTRATARVAWYIQIVRRTANGKGNQDSGYGGQHPQRGCDEEGRGPGSPRRLRHGQPPRGPQLVRQLLRGRHPLPDEDRDPRDPHGGRRAEGLRDHDVVEPGVLRRPLRQAGPRAPEA